MSKERNAKYSTIRVSDIMTEYVHAVHWDMTVQEAIGLLLSAKISGAPVIDQDRKVHSVLSEADLMQFAAMGGIQKPIRDFMARLPKKIVAVRKQDSFAEVFKNFLVNPVRRVIVVDAMGRLQGIVSRRDLLRTFMQTEGHEIPALPPEG